MKKEISVEAMELSFRILEVVFSMQEYKTKEEVIKVATAMSDVAKEDEKYPKDIKDAFEEALNKLNELSFEEMMEIKKIIQED